MPDQKSHDRKLGLLGISLTKAKPPRHDLDVMAEIQDELEPVMTSSGYLTNAPFGWVTLALRYGLKNEDKPHYQRVSEKYGDLPLAIELDTHGLIEADREELKRLFMIAVLRSLIDAGERYKLPTALLENQMKRFN